VCWPSGQVGTGTVVLEASYVLWESGPAQLLGCSSISMASLIIWSMYLDLVERMVVLWSWMH
jgi:hypothetical protein